MDYSISELAIGLASLFIFFYRMIMVMFPMMKDAWEKKDFGRRIKSINFISLALNDVGWVIYFLSS